MQSMNSWWLSFFGRVKEIADIAAGGSGVDSRFLGNVTDSLYQRDRKIARGD